MRCLLPALGSLLRSSRRVDLPLLCDEYDLPTSIYEKRFTKQQYIETRLQKITNYHHLRAVATTYVKRHPLRLYANQLTYEDEPCFTYYAADRATYTIEEILWRDHEIKPLPLWLKKILVEVLARAKLDRKSLILALGRAFVLDVQPPSPLFRRENRSPLQRILEDFPEHPEPRQVQGILDAVGALACSTLRFFRLIEVFVLSNALPNKTKDELLSALRSALYDAGYEMATNARAGETFPTVSITEVSEAKTPRNRFRKRLEVANEYGTLVTYGLFVPAGGIFIFLWSSLSIAYSISRTHYLLVLLPVPLLVCGFLFLRQIIQELRWSWVTTFAASVLSLAAYACVWMQQTSQPAWGVWAAVSLTGIFTSLQKRKQETQSAAASTPMKLVVLLWATSFASMGVLIPLFAIAELLHVQWKLADVSLTSSPPYVLIR